MKSYNGNINFEVIISLNMYYYESKVKYKTQHMVLGENDTNKLIKRKTS